MNEKSYRFAVGFFLVGLRRCINLCSHGSSTAMGRLNDEKRRNAKIRPLAKAGDHWVAIRAVVHNDISNVHETEKAVKCGWG